MSDTPNPGTGLPIDAMGWPVPRTIRAVYRPKRTDNLRECEMSDKIGHAATWRYVGRSNHDEAYPNQFRWTAEDPAWGCWWVPDEDLDLVTTAKR